MEYTIHQVSELTGLSASTLRFYEKEQLFPPVKRNEAGVRVYQEQDLERISLITCLKNTDMPIRDIKEFVALCAEGDGTLENRRQMMRRHKQAVEQRIAELQGYLQRINYKVNYYEQACQEGTEARLKKERQKKAI